MTKIFTTLTFIVVLCVLFFATGELSAQPSFPDEPEQAPLGSLMIFSLLAIFAGYFGFIRRNGGEK